MHILVTGGTGFIGQPLVSALLGAGHTLVVLTRSADHDAKPGLRYVQDLSEIDGGEGFQAFINLAGEGIADKRWTESRKQELMDSRIDTTRALRALAGRLRNPPAVLLSASAVGYYGPQQDLVLPESAESVDSFSHRLCLAWESEAQAFVELGTRVCVMRLGVVLGKDGGAFDQLRKSVQFGVATYMGSGRQWLSWIHRDDVIGAVEFLLSASGLSGAVNLTAPEPVTNLGFSEALKAEQGGFIVLPIPGVLMRVALGEMAEELLLTGQRVIPQRLGEKGFVFRYPALADALPELLAS